MVDNYFNHLKLRNQDMVTYIVLIAISFGL